jgi:hypothetical protein
MPPTIEQIAERELVPYVPSYKVLNRHDNSVAIVVDLLPDETPIGLYHNIPDELKDCLLFTSKGIHVVGTQNSFVAYDDIDSVYAAVDKRALLKDQSKRELVLELGNGERALISVRGQHEYMLDLYAVWKFMKKVIFWRRKRQEADTACPPPQGQK